MKKLYSFKINKETIQEELVVRKDSTNADIKVLEKVQKIVPKTYFIRRPQRLDYDEADSFYAIKLSQDHRAGILTRSEILKRYTNEDVVIKKTYEDYAKKENELQRARLLEKTEENLQKINRLEQELLILLSDMQNFEMNKSSIFEYTAENRARNKTALWWILFLSYKDEDGKEIPLFDGSTFEEKLTSYDKLLEQNDPHLTEVIQKLFYFIPAWYANQLSSEEDFKKAEALLNVEIKKDKDAKEAEKKETEEKTETKESPPETQA